MGRQVTQKLSACRNFASGGAVYTATCNQCFACHCESVVNTHCSCSFVLIVKGYDGEHVTITPLSSECPCRCSGHEL